MKGKGEEMRKRREEIRQHDSRRLNCAKSESKEEQGGGGQERRGEERRGKERRGWRGEERRGEGRKGEMGEADTVPEDHHHLNTFLKMTTKLKGSTQEWKGKEEATGKQNKAKIMLVTIKSMRKKNEKESDMQVEERKEYTSLDGRKKYERCGVGNCKMVIKYIQKLNKKYGKQMCECFYTHKTKELYNEIDFYVIKKSIIGKRRKRNGTCQNL